MNKFKFLEIPEKYQSIQEKLEYLNKLSIHQQNSDNLDMDYSYQLYITKEYYKKKLNNE